MSSPGLLSSASSSGALRVKLPVQLQAGPGPASSADVMSTGAPSSGPGRGPPAPPERPSSWWQPARTSSAISVSAGTHLEQRELTMLMAWLPFRVRELKRRLTLAKVTSAPGLLKVGWRLTRGLV